MEEKLETFYAELQNQASIQFERFTNVDTKLEEHAKSTKG